MPRDPDADEAPGPVVERAEAFLCFGCRGRTLAVPASAVDAVAEPGPMTRVPTAPAAVLGVTYLRGRLLAVLDTEALFPSADPGTEAAERRLVVVRAQPGSLALLCDRVLGLRSLSLDQIRSAREGSGLLGTVEDGAGVIEVLAPAALMALVAADVTREAAP